MLSFHAKVLQCIDLQFIHLKTLLYKRKTTDLQKRQRTATDICFIQTFKTDVMKKLKTPLLVLSLLMLSLNSCKKGGLPDAVQESSSSNTLEIVSDSVSMAASQEIEGRKFVKTAEVNMEVKDVYESSIFIENKLKDLGGFVTNSELQSRIISESTYQTSDEHATLVKKYQTENSMLVQVPTEKLALFLTFINDKKLFLNTRIISAEDVTNNAKIAELENKKLQETQAVIQKMQDNKDKVLLTEQNLSEKQSQKVADISLADQLKYSAVSIYIEEPSLRVAEIAITNTDGINQKYQFNFLYDFKNAILEGFYLIQKIIIGLCTVWPLILIFFAGFYFWKKNMELKVEGSKSEE